jgi:hypothetical protein
MATIPLDEKFIGLSASVDTTQKRSELINEQSQAYTMQDIIDTVPSGPAYKVYTALLSQSGTNNPTVIVLENTMVNPVTIERQSAGNYTVSCNDFNFFTVNKTAISAISPNANGPIIRTAVNNPTTFRIETYNNSITQPYSVSSDNVLNLSMVEIRVYP